MFAADRYWNQFRGPNGDGKSTAKNIPAKIGENQHVTWKTKIHGKGWSSPVVWKNQIWMQTATVDGHELFAVCVDAKTGKIIHDIKVFDVEKPRFCHPTNSYASPTPYIEEGRIYVHFGAYGTACLDTNNGRILWTRRDFKSDDFRGPASSPIVHGNTLFVNFDGVDFQFVVALDKNTGKTIWKRDRTINYGTDNGDRKKAYGTPALINVNGQMQLISPAAVETIAYNPKNGDELWRVRHGGMNAAARPLYEHGLVYISAGSGNKQLIALKPNGKGDITTTNIVWSTGSSVPRRASQIIVGDLFFMINDKGVASCLDAKTGKPYWTKRLQGAYWASPVYVDGKIYCFSKEGRVPVFKASKTFELLADNKFDDGFNASPAFVDDAMILRTFTHLYRIEAKK
ncbi:MAG: PQQ-binding-like beta-propeller repeat protein [Planctomycetaceae bacterium]